MEEKNSVRGNQTDRRFRFLLFTLRWAGIPLRMEKLSRNRRIFNILLHISTYITFTALVLDMIVNINDLKYVMQAIRVVFGSSVPMWMMICQSYGKRDLERLLQLTETFTWEELPMRYPVTGNLTMAGRIPRVKKLTKFAMTTIIVVHGFITCVRIIVFHDLMFNAWYPFDVWSSPMFELMNIFQVVFVAHLMLLFFSDINLYVTLIYIVGSQFEKLEQKLLEIKQTRCINGEADTKQREDREMFCDMQEKLNECIRHHQKIKVLMNSIEDSLNINFFGVFLLIFVVLCGTAFSAVTSWGDWLDVMQATLLYVIYILNLFVFCSLGTALTEQAERTKQAAIGCDWIGTPVSFQRSLVFIIATCNKEFTLTAGKFVPVSNITLMNMVNQSMSMFMFLLQVKDSLEQ